MDTTINRQELAVLIHNNAVEKGFWNVMYPKAHYLMLVFSELGEALEAERKGYKAFKSIFEEELYKGMPFEFAFAEYIKDSVEDELADAYIRMLDLMQGFQIEIQEKEKVNIVNNSPLLSVGLFKVIQYFFETKSLNSILDMLEEIAEEKGINLKWHIENKMKYNSTREILHGKKF